ncbi:acyltransferase [Xanthobacter agilis]|uniref:Acetyltransferase-like isoleucine patch superfamily enzyme n=1 Tax=Xanthobacter agilis TaxID=47492 RepID=A0ABU0LCV9_XANAG|nr:acyltransferase [Xanthobacter agilis]MDQ0504985.1 acetyltransferase-like isoleucine patch superfamily enzyme [Xanthobacter agilis]
MTFAEALRRFVEAGNSFEGTMPPPDADVNMTFEGAGSHLVIGAGVTFRHAQIRFMSGGCVIRIGAGTRMSTFLAVEEGGSIEIGPDTVFTAAGKIMAVEGRKVTIGARCLLSDVRMRTSDSHSIIDAKTRERLNPARDIRIGDDVWIAEDVRIYKGVEVGEGCIVAARSTLTRSLPPRTLSAGTPARVIREDVAWVRERL